MKIIQLGFFFYSSLLVLVSLVIVDKERERMRTSKQASAEKFPSPPEKLARNAVLNIRPNLWNEK